MMHKEWTSGNNCPYCKDVALEKHEMEGLSFYVSAQKCRKCKTVFRTNGLTGEVYVDKEVAQKMKKMKLNITVHSSEWETQDKFRRMMNEMMRAICIVIPIGWAWDEE